MIVVKAYLKIIALCFFIIIYTYDVFVCVCGGGGGGGGGVRACVCMKGNLTVLTFLCSCKALFNLELNQ